MRGLIRIIVAAAAAAVMLVVAPAGQAGGAPALAWSPTTSSGVYDFGTLDAGAGETASQTFTLTNSGGSASGMLTIALSGSAAFTLTADGCTGRSLGPRKSCSVTVEYAPTTDSATDAATLAASGDKPAARASITLTGNSGAPDLTLSPGEFNFTDPHGVKEYVYEFGSVASATQTFTVTNGGTSTTGTLSLSPNNLAPNFALANDTCSGSALAPNGTCTFDISFTAPAGCSSGFHFPGNIGVRDTSRPYIALLVGARCP